DQKVYDAATNAQGLPDPFRTVAGRLPIVRTILGSAKQHIDEGNVDERFVQGVKYFVEACERTPRSWIQAIPKDGASNLERYYKAVKAYGKGNEVENFMARMLEDVQLLPCVCGIKTATRAQQEQIVEAVTELSAVSPSVPENVFQETGFTNTSTESGTQTNAQGNTRQYNTAGGTMNIVLKGAMVLRIGANRSHNAKCEHPRIIYQIGYRCRGISSIFDN
ncbi:hypothetical protein MMC22_007198, partial [Lobaria immixta]|nr:hypothetical protein [Lobaria immixta]